METRQISLSFDKAKQWYKGSDETLKVLALQAYTVQELNPSIVLEALDCINSNSKTFQQLSTRDPKFLDTLQRLSLLKDIADYLNKGWFKQEGNTGYFIYYDSRAIVTGDTNWEKGHFKVGKHDSVKYPLVYFKNSKDAWAVIDYFGKEYLKGITIF